MRLSQKVGTNRPFEDRLFFYDRYIVLFLLRQAYASTKWRR